MKSAIMLWNSLPTYRKRLFYYTKTREVPWVYVSTWLIKRIDYMSKDMISDRLRQKVTGMFEANGSILLHYQVWLA